MKKLFLTIILFSAFAFSSDNLYKTFAQTNNVLVEIITGTWCQWCPCGHQQCQIIENQRPNTLILAYHGPSGSSDPFWNFNGYSIIPTLFGGAGWPSGIISRMSGVQDRSTWRGWVNVASSNFSPGISYNITKTYNSSTRQLTVNVTATALRNIDTTCYINFVVYEDNIIYPQTGNSSCTGGSNYSHKWVVRDMVNGPLGELLKTAPWTQGTTAQKSWTTTLDGSWVDANCNAGVFAYLYGSNLSAGSPVMQTWKESVILTGVKNLNGNIPENYYLCQNYPNPFNPVTSIQFSIPKAGNVTLKIYDMLGNEIATYLDEYINAGVYNAVIDGSNWSSGIYFYTLKTKDFSESRKMTLVK